MIKASYKRMIDPTELAELGKVVADYIALALTVGLIAGFLLCMFLTYLLQ